MSTRAFSHSSSTPPVVSKMASIKRLDASTPPQAVGELPVAVATPLSTSPSSTTSASSSPREGETKINMLAAHPGVRFAEHLVRADDDLTDLAVRYSSSEAEIRRFNRRVVFDSLDNVVGSILYIPLTTDEDTFPDRRPDDQRASNSEVMNILAFQLNTSRAISDHEAKVYLTEANWSVSKAMEAYHADVQWEKDQAKKQAAAKVAAAAVAARHDRNTTAPQEFEMETLMHPHSE